MQMLKTLGALCFIFSVAFFIPMVFFDVDSSIWILTFILAPLGGIFSLWGNSKLLLFLNLLIYFGVFIIMYGLDAIQKYVTF